LNFFIFVKRNKSVYSTVHERWNCNERSARSPVDRQVIPNPLPSFLPCLQHCLLDRSDDSCSAVTLDQWLQQPSALTR